MIFSPAGRFLIDQLNRSRVFRVSTGQRVAFQELEDCIVSQDDRYFVVFTVGEPFKVLDADSLSEFQQPDLQFGNWTAADFTNNLDQAQGIRSSSNHQQRSMPIMADQRSTESLFTDVHYSALSLVGKQDDAPPVSVLVPNETAPVPVPADNDWPSRPDNANWVSQPPIQNIVRSAKDRTVLWDGRPGTEAQPGVLVRYHAESAQVWALQMYNLETKNERRFSLPRSSRTDSAEDPNTIVSPPRLFVGTDSALEIAPPTEPCRVGNGDCAKPRFRLTYFDLANLWSQTHWFEPEFEIRHVRFGESGRVIIGHGPLPDTELWLFDFANPRLPPFKLSLPISNQPPNNLRGWFNGFGLATPLSKQAVGFWALFTRHYAVQNQSRTLPIPFQTPGGVVPQPDSRAYINLEAKWTPNGRTIEFYSGLASNSEQIGGCVGCAQAAVTSSSDGGLQNPKLWDAQAIDGGKIIVQRVLKSPPDPLTEEYQEPNAANGQQNWLIVDGRTFSPLAEVELDLWKFAPGMQLNRVLADRSHRYLVFECRDKFPEGSSSKKTPARPFPSPIVGVYDSVGKSWTYPLQPGRFGTFHPSEAEAVILGIDGRPTLVELRDGSVVNRQFSPLISNLHQMAYSPSGRLLAGLSDSGSLSCWDLETGVPVFTDIACGQPDEAEVAPIMFDSRESRLYLNLMPDPYYQSSPDCLECQAKQQAMAHRFVRCLMIDLSSLEMFWIENSLEFSRATFFSATPLGLQLHRIGSDSVAGPFQFNQGVKFMDDERALLVTVTRPDLGVGRNKVPRVEIWDIENDTPSGPVIELPPDSEVVACHFDDSQVQVVYWLPWQGFTSVTVPLWNKVLPQLISADVPDVFLTWASGYSGTKVSQEGRLEYLEMAEMLDLRRSSTLESGLWSELVQWLSASEFDRGPWPTATEQPDETPVPEPCRPDQALAAFLPAEIFAQRGSIVAGFEYQGGYFWQHQGSPTVWTQATHSDSLVRLDHQVSLIAIGEHDHESNLYSMNAYTLSERRRDAEFVYLWDEERDLEWRLPLRGGVSHIRSIYQQQDPAWTVWHDLDPIPARRNLMLQNN